jgi:diguanylate cyclase (GGDEF)-like protein
MSTFSQKRNLKKMVQAYGQGMSDEGLDHLWDDDATRAVETIYQGLLACVEDDLYLQEFLPFGSIYRVAGEYGVRRRGQNAPIEKVMQEHILLRDVFWEYRRSRSEKVHDFAIEKRVCQCFNNLLQATVRAYQTLEPTASALDPMRDDLTGAFNSMYFMTRLEEEIKRSERYLRDVTLVLFRVDSSFDEGTIADAELMRAVARVLRRNSRASDVLARMESKSFAMLVPETRAADATGAAQRLKAQVLEYLEAMGEPYAGVNIGVGTASYPANGEEPDALIQEAAEDLLRGEAKGSEAL